MDHLYDYYECLYPSLFRKRFSLPLEKETHVRKFFSQFFVYLARIYRKFPFFVSAIMHVNPSSRTSCLVEEEFGWFLSEIFKLIAAINILHV